MSVTLLGSVAGATAAPGTENPVTASHTLSAGSNRRVIVVAVLEGTSSRSIDSATYGGTAMSSLANLVGNNLQVRFFELLEASLPADGANDAVVTFNAAVNLARVWALCVQDADQSAIAAAQIAEATAASISAADDLTSVTDGYIVAGGLEDDNKSTDFTFSGGTLGTEVEHEGATGIGLNGGSNANLSSIPVTAGGTTTVTLTGDTGTAAVTAIGVCFSPAAGGGGGGSGTALPSSNNAAASAA